MSDLIRREDAARIAEDYNLDIWEYSTGNRSRIGSDPVAEAIRALPAVTVQAQIDAAREAALQDAISHVRQALIDDAHQHGSIVTTRSSAMFTAEIIATNALSRIRKGDQP